MNIKLLDMSEVDIYSVAQKINDILFYLHDKENNTIILHSPDSEKYKIGEVSFQRLKKDGIWYAIHDNHIIDYDQYKHDLEERLKKINII